MCILKLNNLQKIALKSLTYGKKPNQDCFNEYFFLKRGIRSFPSSIFINFTLGDGGEGRIKQDKNFGENS